MRLVDTTSLEIKHFVERTVPPYAILSHTWGDDEVTFAEMTNPSERTQRKAGFNKIQNFCNVAKARGIQYGWIDTCSIDKTSSAELSEAITSMYKWYSEAHVCLIYLADVPPVSDILGQNSRSQLEAFKSSRWFSRGWTLQELIAPKTRVFLARDWTEILIDSDENGSSLLNKHLGSITNVNSAVLRDRNLLSMVPVGERMSWAASRQTTREEDAAYSLMGIFGVYFTIQYGEGIESAFRRLQIEIINMRADHSIFGWYRPSSNMESSHSGLLARTPADFMNLPRLGLWDSDVVMPFTMTNVGLHINVHMLEDHIDGVSPNHILIALDCDVSTHHGWGVLALRLRRSGPETYRINGELCDGYRRVRIEAYDALPGIFLAGVPRKNIIVLEDEHMQRLEGAMTSSYWRGRHRKLDRPLLGQRLNYVSD
jgi:hypothetical protein